MKKFLVSMVIMFVFAITLPLAADAQTCRTRKNYRRSSSNVSRNYNRSANRGYYQTRGYSYQRPSFYRRHRNLINIGIGTGAGALIGGLLGGRRGVGLGALAGGGGSALYTYKLNPKKRRYYR